MTTLSATRLMGIETEYGFASLPGSSGAARSSCSPDQLVMRAAERLPSLPDVGGRGVFFGNGSCFYVDSGGHPEYCTPEVDNPWDVVRYAQAGDEFLHSVISENTGRKSRSLLFKCNVDYSGSLTTWACHESYGHRAKAAALQEHLIPHFVSRIIYTGAGGFNPFSPGLEFCLSPRVFHLEQRASMESTCRRGIFHLKDEPLAAGGWHRLHVLCGESLCSHRAAWLKVAITALIVGMTEAGLAPGHAVQLADPLGAMRAFNVDPTCRATASLAGGGPITALAIQRSYLQSAEAYLQHPCMPPWAAAACGLWRETLDRLEAAPSAVNRNLDWAIKHALYRDHAARRGFDAATLHEWTERLRPPRGQASPRGEFVHELVALITGEAEPAAETNPFAAAAAPNRLNQEQMERFKKLRTELFELELRFSQLGPDSIFATLDRAGALDHRVADLTPASIREAVSTAPATGRARLRGELIRKLHREEFFRCGWSTVLDLRGKHLDLSDPFLQTIPDWTESHGVGVEAASRTAASRAVAEIYAREMAQLGAQTPAAPPAPTVPPPPPAPPEPFIPPPFVTPSVLPPMPWSDVYARAKQQYDRGCYSNAHAILSLLEARRREMGPELQLRCLELLSSIQSRRGHGAASLSALEDLRPLMGDSFRLITDFVSAHRFLGLVPGPGITEWIERGRPRLEAGEAVEPVDAFTFRAHWAYALGRQGRVPLALEMMRRVQGDRDGQANHPRIHARALADTADLHRMAGDLEAARSCLDQAERTQRRGGFEGDLADHTLLNRAKLNSDRELALDLIDDAKLIQRRTFNKLGLTRSLLLQARMSDSKFFHRSALRRIVQLRTEVPALQHCSALGRILNGWQLWCSGATPTGIQDRFWGL